MLLSSGKIWYLDEPRQEDLDVEDIAHALSLLCRFGGHCKEFYSVAQHSVLCMQQATRMGLGALAERTVLLHDASEAYLVDLPRPVKMMLPEYSFMEYRLHRLVARQFDLECPHPAYVKEIDDRMLITEQLALMPDAPPYLEGVDPYNVLIGSWGPEVAKAMFLSCYERCCKEG
jgi:hypothetical protein